VLALGAASKEGIRAYLAVQGSFDTQPYLGSRSTFVLGGFGGSAGRALRAGDVIHIGQKDLKVEEPVLPAEFIPTLTREWTVGVLFGPHTAPEFLYGRRHRDALLDGNGRFTTRVTAPGVRLVGPKPKWARPDGGEAGLHPSNIHDNAYAIGTIDFTGDMPICLGRMGRAWAGSSVRQRSCRLSFGSWASSRLAIRSVQAHHAGAG
jgi:urea carboxylase